MLTAPSHTSKSTNCVPELASFVEVRKWYLANAAYCRPFWLYKGLEITHSSNAKAYSMFAKLSAELQTEYPSDKVRALLPVVGNAVSHHKMMLQSPCLLMNVPVEYQEELEML
eukprot:scaffold436580_cov31-Prasinocladus_malaysianus.AAC.1